MMVKAEIVVDEEFPVYRIKRMPSWCSTSIDEDFLAEFDKVSNEWAAMQLRLKVMHDMQEGAGND